MGTTHIIQIGVDLELVRNAVVEAADKIEAAGAVIDASRLLQAACKDVVLQAVMACDPQMGDTLDFGDQETQDVIACAEWMNSGRTEWLEEILSRIDTIVRVENFYTGM